MSRAAGAGPGDKSPPEPPGGGVQPGLGGGQPAGPRGVQDPLQASQGGPGQLDHQHHPGGGHRGQGSTAEVRVVKVDNSFLANLLRHEGAVFTGSFTFSSLAAGQEYEVMVQARSELGWSRQTQPFRFSTPR